MMTFQTYIIESKNTHLTHAADFAFEGGKRTTESIAFLSSLIQMFKGKAKSKVNFTRKWDGAPAIFCGINPENGKFFVGTKSVFNKTPKINYTNADIDRNHGGGLADKLKEALKHLPSLGIKGVLQGDFLFGAGDTSTKDIDGKSFLTFTPNTITYAVGEGDLQKRIKKAKIGIIFHTKYTGDNLQNMKASFDVSRSDFGSSPSVYADDANFRDVTGKANFTAKEYETAIKLLNKAKLSASKARKGSNALAKNAKLFSLINIYVNAKVKEGKYVLSSAEFYNFVKSKLDAEVKKLKSERGRQKRSDANNIVLQGIRSMSRDLQNVFRCNMDIQNVVLHILKKLDDIKTLRTFVRTSDGYKVTSDEGFVASSSGSVVKLVNRLEFSRANFTVAKNWVKG
jgi:hypothetical protein